MMRKCKYCDKVGKKSINTLQDDYLYVDSFYCHTECYKIYLKTKKKMTDELIESEILFIKNKMKKDQQDNQDKDDFLKYIMKYYNIDLSNWQYTKISKVNKGTFNQQMKEGISYCDLLEMWENPKFLRMLEKIDYNKNINKENRLDYDLAIVVKEYDKFKKSKIKKQSQEDYVKDIMEKKKVTKNSISKLNNMQDEECEEVDVFDMI